MAFLPESTLKSAIKTVAARAKNARRRKRRTSGSQNWVAGIPKTESPRGSYK